ncbi:MAG TPA: ergothioneine biosynthesis glutamate--cysteine ligase EgtA [Pseudonocardiaceae bacterium]|nr:ergothioneine biosynthesis glutamate--cysteine ligase EgtA [Pseudonocardiaceae bacterium]
MTAEAARPWTSAPAAPPTVLGSREEAEIYVASVCFKHGPPRLLGAELEWVVQHSGNPHRPLQAQHLAEALGAHVPRSLVPDSPHRPLPYGSTVTVEPGGQLEISSPPCASLTELIATVEGDTAALTELLNPAGLVLTNLGSDPYRPSHRLIDIPRYVAMEIAFDRIGPMGRAMMCSTAAVQVCLDAGTPSDVALRWAALHDLGPVLVAAFANSPWLGGRLTGWVSSRMQAWFALDPVRTRPSPVHWDPQLDWNPAADWARRALDTPLLCQRRPCGSWEVPSGVTFADWLSGALPGRPSTADLDYHLTTLFPPVRPQGYLEVRYLDAQPAGQWLVPVAVLAALLADPEVTAAARDACAPAAGRWLQAAKRGLRDSILAVAAREVFELACAALPALHAPPELQVLLEEITEYRVRRGRCPADDLINAAGDSVAPTGGTQRNGSRCTGGQLL